MNEFDYLVVGSGACAMAFVDEMLHRSNATFAMVDRRHAPGGHWNDAYPFVRLHQPSGFYGVSSKPLGSGRIDETGLNQGYYELASGIEVAHYFHSLMEDVFLPSGRVRYFPLCEYTGPGEITSLLSGEKHQISISNKLVNATRLTTSIPLTHTRNFGIADGVVCVPPNQLPRLAAEYSTVTVLGGGKTGIDSVTWLLGNGYPADSISWVVPRDSWFVNRANSQPGIEFFDSTVGGLVKQWQACATATDVEDLCLRLEKCGAWLRLDENVWPTMFHSATIAERELDALRSIRNTVRLGRVRTIEQDHMQLVQGEVASKPGTLYVDCTASAVADNVNDRTPVFQDGRIDLQMIRPYQPCFSSAMIGFMEAEIDDKNTLQRMTLPTPMTDTVEDWLDVMADSIVNGAQWGQHLQVNEWQMGTRLNAFAGMISQIQPDDTERLALLAKLPEYGPQAVTNLKRMASDLTTR